MTKPICVKCERFYRPFKTGILWEEGKPNSNSTPPGPDQDWSGYKLWAADLYQCPECNDQIVVGHGQEPIVECYQPTYDQMIATFKPLLRVNDC